MTTDTSLRSSFFRERGLDETRPLFHLWADVRWGSKAALTAPNPNFRFDPEPGLKPDIGSGPVRAMNGLMHRREEHRDRTDIFIRSPHPRA